MYSTKLIGKLNQNPIGGEQRLLITSSNGYYQEPAKMWGWNCVDSLKKKDVQQTREDWIEVHLIWFMNTFVSVFILKIQLVVSLNHSSCVSCIITLQFLQCEAYLSTHCSCSFLLGATCPIMMSKLSRGVAHPIAWGEVLYHFI